MNRQQYLSVNYGMGKTNHHSHPERKYNPKLIENKTLCAAPGCFRFDFFILAIDHIHTLLEWGGPLIINKHILDIINYYSLNIISEFQIHDVCNLINKI